MAKVIIIGAGLTGLSAAYHLEKKGFTNFSIIEKEKEFGGLCRSVKQDGFTFDYTGHLLHSSDPYFSSFLECILDGEKLNSIQRHSFVYSQQIYTPYPYQINLYGLPIETIIDCVEGFVNRKSSIRRPKSFSEWVLKFFGQGHAKSFFFPYQSKLLRYDPRKLAAGWTGRFVPQTSLRQMLYGALCANTQGIGYNASFLYPAHGGIQCLIDRLVKKINRPIMINKMVVEIDLKNKIIVFDDGDFESFDAIINTMPLDQLLCCLRDRSSTSFLRTSNKLLCTSVVCLNLGIARELDFEKHWIYYPEKQYPFYRLGFYHNFSQAMVPASCSSIYVECSHRNKSERSIQSMINSARSTVQRLFKFSDKETLTENIINMPHAYVVYDLWRERNLKALLKRLEHEGIYSIGRYGAWKYSSMQESVLDGKKVAETIVLQPARRVVSPAKKIKERSNIREQVKEL